MVYEMGGVSTSNDGGEGTVGYHIAHISYGCNTPYNSKKFNGAIHIFLVKLSDNITNQFLAKF